MTLRFRYRHVHATVFDYVRAQCVALGWGDASLSADDPVNAEVNFGTTPATYLDFQPEEAGRPIRENTIAITLGDEPAAVDQELGAGLRQVAIVVFVDVYGANQAISHSICSDVKTLLEDVYLQVQDHSHQPAVDTDEQLELDKDDVSVEKPDASIVATDIKRHWRVVKTVARVNYIGS